MNKINNSKCEIIAKNIATTKIYTDVDNESKLKAVEILDNII